MEYKGQYIEDKVYNRHECLLKTLDYNDQVFTKDNLLEWCRAIEEKEIELQNNKIDYNEVVLDIYAQEEWDTDYKQSEACMDISLRWGEAETEQEKQLRVKKEIRRIEEAIERKCKLEKAQKLVNKTKIEQAMKILQENGYTVFDACKKTKKNKRI